MNRKMIAAVISFTLIFVVVFTACNGNGIFNTDESTTLNTVYRGEGEVPYVTDTNGDRVYSAEGAAVVYATDSSGNKVTDANGVYETLVQAFEPISESDRVEYLGYILKLPEGWAITDEPNRFINEEAQHTVAISVIDDDYESYYEKQKNTYDVLAGEDADAVSWTEDVSIGSGCIKVVRFTARVENQMNIMYFFENSGNLYKILFQSNNADDLIDDSLTFCNAITYKPYLYYIETEEAEE